MKAGILDGVAKECLSEEATFDQRPEWSKIVKCLGEEYSRRHPKKGT